MTMPEDRTPEDRTGAVAFPRRERHGRGRRVGPHPALGAERGAAAVELALILPILLTLVMGIITFGMGYNTKITLTSGVREGARTLALGGTTADAKARVMDLTTKLKPALTDSEITINSTCPAGATTGQAKLTATYHLGYNLLFANGTWTITAVGVMRCGL